MEQTQDMQRQTLIDNSMWTALEIEDQERLEFVPRQRAVEVDKPQIEVDEEAYDELLEILICIAGRCENCFAVLDTATQILVAGVTEGVITATQAVATLRAKLLEKSQCALCKTANW